MPEDYYALLGVDPDAAEAEILRAYRERAAEHHPDVSDDPDAEATFRRLAEAKAVLTDESRRRAYDRLGHERFVDRMDREAAGDARRAGSAETRGGDRRTARGRGDRVVGDRLGGFVGPRRVGRAASRPGVVDLASLLGSRRVPPEARVDESPEPGAGAPDDASRCPRCRGRGAFVHDIDTGRGRRRRLEACEECDGTGTVAA